MLIISHRGNCENNPGLENSIEAAEFASLQKVDGLEIDVNLSLDKKLLVYHDDFTGRFYKENSDVRKISFSDLKNLELKDSYKQKYPNFFIPLFSEFIKSVPLDKYFVIELKGSLLPDLVDSLKIEISNSDLKENKLKLIGFDSEMMKYAKTVFPNVECWLIADTKEEKFDLIELIRIALDAKLDSLDLRADNKITLNSVKTIKEAGLKLNLYVDSEDTTNKSILELAVSLNPESITSDTLWFSKR